MTTHPITFSHPHGHGKSTMTAALVHHKALVKQAQKWVSQTFFGTMLKEMRKSPFKSELFSGGRGGEAFNEMFDQQLADHMGRGSGSKLVNSLVKKIEGAHGAQAMAAMRKKSPPIADALRAYAQSKLQAGAK